LFGQNFPFETKIYQVLWRLEYKECLKQRQNSGMAGKIKNLQSALTHCQSIFAQVLRAISPGAK
jgi:hypothetical protein